MVSMRHCLAKNATKVKYSQLCCDVSLNFFFKVVKDVAAESIHWFDLETIRGTFCMCERVTERKSVLY